MGDNFTESALADYNKVLLLDPKHENTLFNRGLLFLEKHQVEKAFVDFNEVISINSRASDAYLGLGKCHIFNNKSDLALKDFNKAIEINPLCSEAYYNRGGVYILIGDNEKANDDFCRTKQVMNKEEIFNQGLSYISKFNDVDKAIEAFTDVITVDQKLSSAFLNRGNCYFKKGLYDESIQDYDVVLSLRPHEIETYKYCEWVKYFRNWAKDHSNHMKVNALVHFAIESAWENDYNTALEYFQQILQICSNNAFVFYRRGLLYASIGENAKSIRDLTETIKLAPNIAAVYYDRGNLYRKQEMYDRALDDYNIAIQLFPKFSDAFCNRGVVYFSEKQYKSAFDDYKTTLKINPHDDDARANLMKVIKFLN
jgi:tetratricopeptide (TPR) repeat protein